MYALVFNVPDLISIYVLRIVNNNALENTFWINFKIQILLFLVLCYLTKTYK